MARTESEQLVFSVEARIGAMEKQMARAGRVTDQAFTGMERRSRRAARTMEREMAASASRVGDIMKNYGGGLFSSAGSGVVAALAPMVAFNRVLSTLSDAGKLVKVAERVGLTTKAFQELQFGMSLAGIEASAFETNMEHFSKRIGDAATKGGTLAEILKANGVAIRDSNGDMRSSEALLRDYAELIKNAGSEQERLVLATEAFGAGGADMVSALKDGKKSLDDMTKAAAEAGGTIDDELLRRAEELDDMFGKMWRRFEINSKNAILTAVTYLDDLVRKAEEVGNSSIFRKIAEGAARMGLVSSDVTFLDPNLARAAGQQLGPDARVRDAFQAGASQSLAAADEALVAELQKRYGTVSKKAATTIIPGGDDSKGGHKGGGRNAAAAAAIREAEAVLRVIESLEHERSLIGATDVERAKSNALRAAGSAATAEQRGQIGMLVEAIYRENEALDQARARMEEMREVARDVMGGFVSDIMDGKSAVDALADALKNVANRLMNSGLDALFGGGGGGAIHGTMFSLNLRRGA